MVMTSYLRPTPVFCTAIGTAIGFYFLSSFGIVSLIIFLSIMLAVLMLCCSLFAFCRYAARIDFRFKLGRRLQLVSVCIFVFATGLVLGISAYNAGRIATRLAILRERVTAIEGIMTEDPRITSSGNAMAQLSLRRCAASTPNGLLRATASGEITVFFPQTSVNKLREFGRGTTVFLEGSLRFIDTDNCTFGASSVHVTKPAPRIERIRTGVRLKLIERTKGKEWGGLAIALLLGIKDNLDSDLAAMYRSAGCSYILALSGMHLAVLAAIIAFLLRRPLGLKLASVIGTVIICIYCLFVGPMPSLYRAGLMYLLGTVAILGFLPRQPLAILSLSFLIQIIITPAAGNQISFILSYLALFGIIVIGQPLYELFAGKVPDFLMQPLSASCGAFLATAGIAGSVFGYAAPIGIVIGLVLVPLTTLYMVLSLVWIVIDFGWPLSVLYRFMEWIVSLAAKVPAIITSVPAVVIIFSIVISIIIPILEYIQRKARIRMEKFND